MSIPAKLICCRTANPHKAAIAFEGESWTYTEFDELTDKVARNLLTGGIEPGDRVAFHLSNGLALALGYVGCLKAGGVVVPINTRLKGPEIDYILRHSGSRCYFSQPELYAGVANSCPAIDSLEFRYLTAGASGGCTKPFDDLLLEPDPSVFVPEIAGDQMAAILYTSGTTARPKGVVHSHQSLLKTAQAMCQMGLDHRQIAVVVSSMAHMVGFAMIFLSGLLNGATVVITRPFDFKNTLQAFARHRGTYVLGLPVMFSELIQAQTELRADVASGQFYFCGGDSVPSALQETFHTVFGPVCEVYGSTEVAPAAWNRIGQRKVGSIGFPDEMTAFRLIDADGRDVKPGEVGEICVKAPHLMVGYWQDPEATAVAFQDGWFHTGDLASCDRDGFYWFGGRKKEIIIRGGSNISPQEVEAVFYQHPAVGEVGVVGRPDDIWGEVVTAFVALRSGHAATERELLAFARERLADYKIPECVIFRDELPKGISGKIERRALKVPIVNQEPHAGPASLSR